jgi:DNA-binding NarL/FixJ family response regulator
MHTKKETMEMMNNNTQRRITRREKEILTLAMRGLPTKAIAAELGIEKGTVEVHRSNMIKKYQCGNLLEVVVLAVRQQWI